VKHSPYILKIKYTILLLCLSCQPCTPDYSIQLKKSILYPRTTIQMALFKLCFSDTPRNRLAPVILESVEPFVVVFVILCAHDCNSVLQNALLIFHSKRLAIRKFAWALQNFVRLSFTITVFTYLLAIGIGIFSSINVGFVSRPVRLVLRYY